MHQFFKLFDESGTDQARYLNGRSDIFTKIRIQQQDLCIPHLQLPGVQLVAVCEHERLLKLLFGMCQRRLPGR